MIITDKNSPLVNSSKSLFQFLHDERCITNKCFIALNVQGKKQIDIIYKDGRNFRQLIDTKNDIENVQCMECYEGNIGLKR